MRLSTIVVTFAVVFSLASGLVYAKNAIDKTNQRQRLMFVISGTSGSMDGDRLSLNGVQNVIYFSDRPVRIAGQMRLSDFVDGWNKGSDSFKADPPNAVLSILSDKGDMNVVVEILNPSMDGDSVSFDIKPIKGTIPDDIDQSSLFIDEIINGGAWTGT